MTNPFFPVTTICGSMRFYPHMLKVAEALTATGMVVLMPFVYYNSGVKLPNDEFAAMLDTMHKAKIDMSGSITVVSNASRYIGESTQSEIDYAQANGKSVYYDDTAPDSQHTAGGRTHEYQYMGEFINSQIMAAFPNQPEWRFITGVSEEAGEVLKAYHRYSGTSRRNGPLSDVAEELADTVLCAFMGASKLDIDLDTAIHAKFRVSTSRGWKQWGDEQPAEIA
jgi:NTP pyrophosphatase (non-canonical NTP hydrolase)